MMDVMKRHQCPETDYDDGDDKRCKRCQASATHARKALDKATRGVVDPLVKVCIVGAVGKCDRCGATMKTELDRYLHGVDNGCIAKRRNVMPTPEIQRWDQEQLSPRTIRRVRMGHKR